MRVRDLSDCRRELFDVRIVQCHDKLLSRPSPVVGTVSDRTRYANVNSELASYFSNGDRRNCAAQGARFQYFSAFGWFRGCVNSGHVRSSGQVVVIPGRETYCCPVAPALLREGAVSSLAPRLGRPPLESQRVQCRNATVSLVLPRKCRAGCRT